MDGKVNQRFGNKKSQTRKAKKEIKPNNKPMNHPQIYFYPHTIQNEFPYQIGNLCQVYFHNTDKHPFDKYKLIYTKLEEVLMMDSETITIDFKDAISKKYIQYKLEGLKKLFDWLNKQWSFGMKKMNSLTITYGRYPLIKILFSYGEVVDANDADDYDDGYGNRYDFCDDMDEDTVGEDNNDNKYAVDVDDEPLHNSYIDLYDFEKYWNEMIPNTSITHNSGLQGRKYIKKEIENDLYENDDYIRSLANADKINAFLEGRKKRPYALAHLWNRYWYEGIRGFILRKWFDRPLLTRQILLLENSCEMVNNEIIPLKNSNRTHGLNFAIGLAGMVGISYFWIKNIFEFGIQKQKQVGEFF